MRQELVWRRPSASAVAGFILFTGLCCAQTVFAAEPLKLHPDDSHYLLFRGKPTILVTSGEHYGAVLNRDFDYQKYLDELHSQGLNLTRTFSGMYCEVPGSFGITENTLAPKPGRYLAPWARSTTPGNADGGMKFDLQSWDADYFSRLKDFVAAAGKRDIVVELVLFCTIYDDKLWEVNPLNARNNTSKLAAIGRNDVYTLMDIELTKIQEALVRKIVGELAEFDNVYFEVCNEPYFGGVTRQWNDRIVATIENAEASGKARHLIAQNIANGSLKIEQPNPAVSIFNFHYATPPDAVGQNFDLLRVISDDETGFRGKDDPAYRSEAWDFFMAGGAIYNGLDYSFSVSRPDGTADVTTSPGGGGRTLRKQLQILKGFLDGFDLVKMAPNNSVITGGIPDKGTARALVEEGKSYAIYLRGGPQANLVVELPAGTFSAQWLDVKSGKTAKEETFDHAGGKWTLVSPDYQDDIALRIVRK